MGYFSILPSELGGEIREVTLDGAGSGHAEQVQAMMEDEIRQSQYSGEVLLIRFKQGRGMNERGCYCSLWQKNPAHLESEGIPPGYCGLCDRCGQPGHSRHFPGAAPYTGSWCDYHYRVLSIIHPLGSFGVLLYGGGLLAMGLGLWYFLKG